MEISEASARDQLSEVARGKFAGLVATFSLALLIATAPDFVASDPDAPVDALQGSSTVWPPLVRIIASTLVLTSASVSFMIGFSGMCAFELGGVSEKTTWWAVLLQTIAGTFSVAEQYVCQPIFDNHHTQSGVYPSGAQAVFTSTEEDVLFALVQLLAPLVQTTLVHGFLVYCLYQLLQAHRGSSYEKHSRVTVVLIAVGMFVIGLGRFVAGGLIMDFRSGRNQTFNQLFIYGFQIMTLPSLVLVGAVLYWLFAGALFASHFLPKSPGRFRSIGALLILYTIAVDVLTQFAINNLGVVFAARLPQHIVFPVLSVAVAVYFTDLRVRDVKQ